MGSILKDAGYALKLLVKQKSFTAAALVTLALCTGANAAMFSVLNSLLIKPLPYEGADRLVHIYNSYPRAGVDRGSASVPDYYDRREHIEALEAVALMQSRGMTIGESGRPERVRGRAVTPSFFGMLGVRAAAGRTFLEEEGEPGGNLQAMLSWRLWQDRYGGAADVIGSTIRINDVAHTIVGIMPRAFVFQDADDRIWIPLAFELEQRGDDARHSNNWEMIAKLRPGATIEQAQQQIDALNARNLERTPQFAELLQQVGFRTIVADYRADLTRAVRSTLWLLQAGVLLVLLIGCVNIANLVLVRSTARHRELATRSALGAGRSRLARQLLTESIVLALAGGALGLLVGWGGVRAFSTFAAERLPRGTEIAFDGSAMLAAVAISLLAGLLFGAIPVARLLRADLSGVFRDGGRTGTASRGTQAWRSALVVAQVSLAFALLAGAGLMIVSFARTLDVDPGFEPANVLTASISLPITRYGNAAARRQFTGELLERVRAVPGVSEAAVTNVLPFGEDFNANAVTPEGYTAQTDDAIVAPTIVAVSDGYFEALGIAVTTGRMFHANDTEGAQDVAVIDRSLAERFWPGQDALGRRIAQGVPQGGNELRFFTIVGVSENLRSRDLTADDPVGNLYFPAAQTPPGQLFLVVKTSIAPAGVANGIRTALGGIDPDLPLYNVQTMEERLTRSVATERFRMILLAGFGTLALFLAAIGLYGVLAYAVAQRSGEIGIRMALGSSDLAIFRMVVVQGVRLLGIGLVLGLLGSLAVGRVVQTMLYGVAPSDPAVMTAVLALLSLTALAACVLPAWRAMKVDPLVAIRSAD
jgi:putative ABC transport system permease protein